MDLTTSVVDNGGKQLDAYIKQHQGSI